MEEQLNVLPHLNNIKCHNSFFPEGKHCPCVNNSYHFRNKMFTWKGESQNSCTFLYLKDPTILNGMYHNHYQLHTPSTSTNCCWPIWAWLTFSTSLRYKDIILTSRCCLISGGTSSTRRLWATVFYNTILSNNLRSTQ